jgi:hypothetical protein
MITREILGAALAAALAIVVAVGGTVAWVITDTPAPPAPATPVASAPLPSVEPSPVVEATHEESITPVSSPAPLNREDVRVIQKRLQGFGYNPGRIDGHAGRMTAAAAMHYQQDRSLPQSGIIDRALLEALQRDPAPVVAAPPVVKVATRGKRSSARPGYWMEPPRAWQ